MSTKERKLTDLRGVFEGGSGGECERTEIEDCTTDVLKDSLQPLREKEVQS